MYHRQSDQKEVLFLLKEMDQKISRLEVRLDQLSGRQEERKTSAEKMETGQPAGQDAKSGFSAEGKQKHWNQPMQDLSQMQYELSNEISAGIEKLKRIILQSEKVLNEAKKS